MIDLIFFALVGLAFGWPCALALFVVLLIFTAFD